MSWYTKGEECRSNKEFRTNSSGILKLVGMLTKNDEEIIRAGLATLKGVREVNLNINTNRLIVVYDSTIIGIAAIACKLGQMGYQYLKSA